MRRRLAGAVLASLAAATPAAAADEVRTVLYRCERGVEIRASYVNTDDTSHAVIQAEGRQAALTVQRAASGARYAAAPGVSGYIWWTKGPKASLAWFDAATSEEVMLYMDCAEVEP